MNMNDGEAIQTEFLVIGAGPAGASLKGIMISSATSTASTPRAHIINMAALECLRDIGLDEEVNRIASKSEEYMVHTRWCHSMAGEEYARIYSWGNDPRRKGDYEMASPCTPVDLPQTSLEPILVRHAAWNGFTARFDTTLLSFVQDTNGHILATVRDDLTGQEYHICARYLFGADGGRSQVVKELGLPLDARPGQGLAINVLVRADLSHLVEHRKGNLHWVMQPDHEHPEFGWMAIVRMVKPWNEWMFILFPTSSFDMSTNPSMEEYTRRIQEIIGDDTKAEILSVSKWLINETVAEEYSRDNIFCLGDAVHRHPPLNGLGSNTCIQDAFNLAWKVAYVYRGIASRALLSTYSQERQPVGRSIVTRANQAFRDHFRIWDSLGMLHEDVSARRRALQELSAPTAGGRKRRLELQRAVLHTCHEFHGLGVEMGQQYTGLGIYTDDEIHLGPDHVMDNHILYYEPSTYPGCRLPHAWLNKATPTKMVSTIDLAGHGAFTLFTGAGGDVWKSAVRSITGTLRVPMQAYSIGFRQDWEDSYFDWASVRGVEESGAILIRPDRFVAWRAFEAIGDPKSCEAKLLAVMRSILGIS